MSDSAPLNLLNIMASLEALGTEDDFCTLC